MDSALLLLHKTTQLHQKVLVPRLPGRRRRSDVVGAVAMLGRLSSPLLLPPVMASVAVPDAVAEQCVCTASS